MPWGIFEPHSTFSWMMCFLMIGKCKITIEKNGQVRYGGSRQRNSVR